MYNSLKKKNGSTGKQVKRVNEPAHIFDKLQVHIEIFWLVLYQIFCYRKLDLIILENYTRI